MDLSSNDISDVGVEALSSCLMRGGGQDMIELDLRGNRDVCVGGGDNGGVLEALKRERRVLNVLVGKVVKEEVIEVVGTVKKKETTTVTTMTTSSLPTTGRQEHYSDIVQNIFQMAGEDDDDSDDSDDDEGAGLDGTYLNPEEESERLWSEVRRYVVTSLRRYVVTSLLSIDWWNDETPHIGSTI